MHAEEQQEQTILDIEILAVQIEEHRKHQLTLRTNHYYDQLKQQKQQEYREFKNNLTAALTSKAPIALGLVGLGIAGTQSFVMGGVVGIGAASALSMLWPRVSEQVSPKAKPLI